MNIFIKQKSLVQVTSVGIKLNSLPSVKDLSQLIITKGQRQQI